jgi:hypothetical protein
VDRDDVAALADERLVDGQEVADRGLRGGRQRLGRAQGVVERGEVDDVRLALCPLAVVDVEADLADPELGDDLPRQVVGGVGDHRDVRHPGTLDNHRDDDPGDRGDGSRRVARHAPAGGARRRRAVLVRERSPLDELDGLDVELVYGDVLDRPSCAARCAGCSACSTSPASRRCAPSADRTFAVNVGGTRSSSRRR